MARKSVFGIATWWRAEVPFGWLLMLALLSGLDAHWSLAKTAAGTTDWLDVAAQFSAGDINAQTQSAQQYSAMTISGRGLVSTVKRCNQSDDSALHGATCTKLTLRGKHHHRVLLYLPPATGTALMNLKGQDVAFHSCKGRTIQMWGLGTKQTCDLNGQNAVKVSTTKTEGKGQKKKTVEWSRALRRLMVSNSKKRPKYIEMLSTAQLSGRGKIRSIRACSWLDTASAYAPDCQRLSIEAGKAKLNVYLPTKGPLAVSSLKVKGRYRFKRCDVVQLKDWVLWVSVFCDVQK